MNMNSSSFKLNKSERYPCLRDYNTLEELYKLMLTYFNKAYKINQKYKPLLINNNGIKLLCFHMKNQFKNSLEIYHTWIVMDNNMRIYSLNNKTYFTPKKIPKTIIVKSFYDNLLLLYSNKEVFIAEYIAEIIYRMNL